MADTNTRLLDTIDLTGDEPVVTTKIIKEIFISLSDDDDSDAEEDDNAINDDDEENIAPLIRKVRVTSKKCEVCLEEVSKYTCPCCTMRTCSLDCVLVHKQRTGCSGQRDKTSFVPRTELNNIHLLNDYRLLEEVGRVTDNARRDMKARKPWRGRRVNKLYYHATRSSVRWYCMEKGMKRHEENRSFYNIQEKCIEWMVKLVFVDISKELCENTLETEVLANIIEPYVNEEKIAAENKITFATYLQRDNSDIRVFFRNEFDSGNNLRYTEVNTSNTLRECLTGTSVLEYPEFHIVLDEHIAKRMISEEIVKDKVIEVVVREKEVANETEVVMEKEIVTRLTPLGDWLDMER